MTLPTQHMSIIFFPRELYLENSSLARSVAARPHALKFGLLTFKNL